jgi:hypothetical protein
VHSCALTTSVAMEQEARRSVSPPIRCHQHQSVSEPPLLHILLRGTAHKDAADSAYVNDLRYEGPHSDHAYSVNTATVADRVAYDHAKRKFVAFQRHSLRFHRHVPERGRRVHAMGGRDPNPRLTKHNLGVRQPAPRLGLHAGSSKRNPCPLAGARGPLGRRPSRHGSHPGRCTSCRRQPRRCARRTTAMLTSPTCSSGPSAPRPPPSSRCRCPSLQCTRCSARVAVHAYVLQLCGAPWRVVAGKAA